MVNVICKKCAAETKRNSDSYEWICAKCGGTLIRRNKQTNKFMDRAKSDYNLQLILEQQGNTP